MDTRIRSLLSGTIEFSALNRELSIPINVSRLRNVLDIELQMYCSPTVIPLISSAQLTGGEDFRLYINKYNVTNILIEELKLIISEIDHETLKFSYLEGANSYLNFAKAMNMPQDQIDRDFQKVQEIANDSDWENKIVQLGNRTVGWSGNLHCLNFLYRHLPLKPISINSIWKRFIVNHTEDLPSKLSGFSQLVITFSQNGSPSYDSFSPTENIPSGRLYYQLELIHKNPIEPRLRQIAQKLKTISQQLEKQRIDYLTPIKTGIDKAGDDLTLSHEEIITELNGLKDAVSQIG